jgi:DNA-binding MarR family transcriptional regulator
MAVLLKTNEKKEEYFAKLCYFFKAKEELILNSQNSSFNRTEIRMLLEIIFAQYHGERLISTQIAKRIGVTRSAVSQMVMRMEEQGIIRRVPVEGDKKTSYVELSETALKEHGDELEESLNFVGELVEEFGVKNFEKMCELFVEFCEMARNKVKQAKIRAKTVR